MVFAKKIPEDSFSKITGVEGEIKDNRGNFHVKGSLQPFLKVLSEHEVLILNQIETSLEDVFMKYYERGKK